MPFLEKRNEESSVDSDNDQLRYYDPDEYDEEKDYERRRKYYEKLSIYQQEPVKATIQIKGKFISSFAGETIIQKLTEKKPKVSMKTTSDKSFQKSAKHTTKVIDPKHIKDSLLNTITKMKRHNPESSHSNGTIDLSLDLSTLLDADTSEPPLKKSNLEDSSLKKAALDPYKRGTPIGRLPKTSAKQRTDVCGYHT